MTPAENEDDDVCALCDRPLDLGVADTWLGLEVYRPDDDYMNVAFCQQEHAAEWLTRPLPPVQSTTQFPTTWRDRLGCWLAAALFAFAAGLMLLGAYALVRLLGGWD